MAESRYEKYIVRKPAVIMEDGQAEVPERIDVEGLVDTGPLILCANKLIKEADSNASFGIISGDTAVGTGPGRLQPHKHDYDELFLFLGTNPKDISDLGAEAEFWLGEGEELEKVVLNTSSSVYVPAGVAHFPLIWRNVKKPVIFVVITCNPPAELILEPASLEGRPM